MEKVFLVISLCCLGISCGAFLPTVSPRSTDPAISSQEEDAAVAFGVPLILNRLNLQRSEAGLEEVENDGGLPGFRRPRKKKYLKKIVVRRRPKEGRLGLHEKGYRMIGPMEYAKEGILPGLTTPSIRGSTPGFRGPSHDDPSSNQHPLQAHHHQLKPRKGFKKSKDFMDSVKIINGIKLKKWKTKKPVLRDNPISDPQVLPQEELANKERTRGFDPEVRDHETFFGDKVNDYDYEEPFDDRGFNQNAIREEEKDYVTDDHQIQRLRETYFSTTEKYSDLTNVNINNLGYTVTPAPFETSTTSSPETILPEIRSEEFVPFEEEIKEFEEERERTPPSTTTVSTPPPFDRSHLPKAFEFVPEIYLANLTAQDILFGDPFTHTHPLGTHPLLPVHKGYDLPHSHPPYKDEPVIHLLPKLSSIMRSFLFPDLSSEDIDYSDYESESDPNNNSPKRHAEITYSYTQNASHFSHEVKMPGHHQFHSQGLPSFKRSIAPVLKAEGEEQKKIEDPSSQRSRRPALALSSSNLKYSPVVPDEFVSSLSPRLGTSSKIDYNRRKSAFESGPTSS